MKWKERNYYNERTILVCEYTTNLKFILVCGQVKSSSMLDLITHVDFNLDVPVCDSKF